MVGNYDKALPFGKIKSNTKQVLLILLNKFNILPYLYKYEVFANMVGSINFQDGIIHFIEVKTINVSYPPAMTSSGEVGRGETNDGNHQPEENVHYRKRQRLARAIKTYLLENKVPDETEWQVDVMAVFLDFNTRRAKIRMTENVLL